MACYFGKNPISIYKSPLITPNFHAIPFFFRFATGFLGYLLKFTRWLAYRILLDGKTPDRPRVRDRLRHIDRFAGKPTPS
jgi:hypothetical protein